MTEKLVPDDFPREPDLGAVPGVQPKVLVRKTGGRYQSALTEEELLARYDTCEDLAVQLCDYAARKSASTGMALDVALLRAEKGARAKVDSGEWEFSQSEVAWVLKRTRQLMLDKPDT